MIEYQSDKQEHSELIAEFNRALAELRNSRVDWITLNRDDAATTVGHCVCCYDWVRYSYLNRVVNVAENYAHTIDKQEALCAAILGRSLIETIAHFHFFLAEIRRYLLSKQFAKAYYKIAQFMLGGDHRFEIAGRKKLKKINTMNSVQSLDDEYGSVVDTYNWLSEFVHPNSLGTVVIFGRKDSASGRINFIQKPDFTVSHSPALDSACILPLFKELWENSVVLRREILEEWKPTAEVYDLFEHSDEQKS